jgi:CRISPR-associated protein Cmr2
MTYTAVTFAPVQSFIRASRKLRDLYGSSLLLSHLARALADDAASRGLTVISPASVSSSRGVPNVLVIEGDYRKGHASAALLSCWKRVLEACCAWLEREIRPEQGYLWGSSWKACGNHTWELFHGQGASIEKARQALAINKQERAWSVPNWTGESSTLSSAEAVVRPLMGAVQDPRTPTVIRNEARSYLDLLRKHPDLGLAFVGEKEEISLTELVKRLITYKAVIVTALKSPNDSEQQILQLIPPRFEKASTRAKEADKSESIVWFMADGDGVGNYLESLRDQFQASTPATVAVADKANTATKVKAEAEALSSFSASMRDWAAGLYTTIPAAFPEKATVVYAGGDDLFGALHESEPGDGDLNHDDLWQWLKSFPTIWKRCEQKGLTVSMGLVWADAQVPQREALQHARDAEASAKARGKNRFALRLLYASGNHLEWTCPWDWLDPILEHYTDREGRSRHPANQRCIDGRDPRWRHLAEDLQWLRSRQAIALRARDLTDAQRDATERTARTLWQAYFPGCELLPEPPQALASSASDPDDAEPPFRASFDEPEKGRRFDQWLLDLGQVMAGLEKYRPSKKQRRPQP